MIRSALIALLLSVPALAEPCSPSASVSLVAPDDDASLSSPVAFSWSAVPGAAEYRVWISVNGSEPIAAIRTTSTAAATALPSGAIEWYVEALFSSCSPLFSAHRHLAVSRAATCSDEGPKLLAPAGGVQQSPVTLTWSAVPGALAYRVWVSVNDGAFVDVDETRQTSLTGDLPAGKIAWYVEVIREGCPAAPSSKGAFVVVKSPCVNAAPVTIAPADNATNLSSPVTFAWSAVEGAMEYRVFTSVDGGDLTLLGTTSETSLKKFLRPGSWTWAVQAVFDQCPSTRSAASHFTIPKAANCPPAGPQLVAPVDGATNVTSPVTFDWAPVAGAAGYALFVRVNDGTPTALDETTSTQLRESLPDGTFEWWVVALSANCPPVLSSRSTFTIAPVCDSRRPVPIVPQDGATGLTSPVQLAWSRTPNARSYNVWIASGADGEFVAQPATDNTLTATVTPGLVRWYVEAVFDACPSVSSPVSNFRATAAPPCGTPQTPLARVQGRAASGAPYTLRWTSVANASWYEVQESPWADFAAPAMQLVGGVGATFTHDATTPARYFYRVRAVSDCNDQRSAWSRVTTAVVVPQGRSATIDVDSTASATQTIALPPRSPETAFSATADKPWVTVTPASGTIGAGGATLTVTTDRDALHGGTNKASVIVTYATAAAGRLRPTDDTSTSVPISVTVATPASTSGKNTPPPNSLIIPAVAHASGWNGSNYTSDVRLANVSAAVMRYQLNFTLSRTDGTQTGQSATIDVDPGQTFALDDILDSFFGIGADDSSATGTLEVRPLTSTSTSVSIASSRTFTTTESGTFGEFIPAIPFSSFIANASPNPILSLQHLSQNDAYRTNLGLVEGAGESASVLIHVFDDGGAELAQIPLALLPGEHRQLTSFLQANAITLNDGRIEIEVTSPTGNVSGYASVVDNATNDAYLVMPVLKNGDASNRFTLPLDPSPGKQASIRLFNPGTSSVTASIADHPPQGFPDGLPLQTVTVPAGQVVALDDIATSGIGSKVITTPSSSNLIITSRMITPSGSGTFGEFVPAVTAAEGVGLGDRTLQLLQIEDSDQYKTTLGVTETSGSAVTVEVAVFPPDAKVYPKVRLDLDAGRSAQIPLSRFGLGNIYNARVTVKVVSGSGRVTAYGSLVDEATGDPTRIPGQ